MDSTAVSCLLVKGKIAVESLSGQEAQARSRRGRADA